MDGHASRHRDEFDNCARWREVGTADSTQSVSAICQRGLTRVCARDRGENGARFLLCGPLPLRANIVLPDSGRFLSKKNRSLGKVGGYRSIKSPPIFRLVSTIVSRFFEFWFLNILFHSIFEVLIGKKKIISLDIQRIGIFIFNFSVINLFRMILILRNCSMLKFYLHKGRFNCNNL